MKLQLIDNARHAWRFAVMWVQGVGAAAAASWLLLSEGQQQAVLGLFGVTPDKLLAVGALVIFLSGMVARLIKQDIAARD